MVLIAVISCRDFPGYSPPGGALINRASSRDYGNFGTMSTVLSRALDLDWPADVRRTEPAAFPDVYLCVNSDHENNYALTQSPDHLKPELTSYHVVILDIAESEALAGYARSENVFDYRPHAETDLSWLVGTLLRGSSKDVI
jgi:hypothetical protein